MSSFLCIRVQFLLGEYHGRGELERPEWPPSPLRVFQALAAASAARWNERERITHAADALRWLESQPPPRIVAAAEPPVMTGHRLYVPDNVSDKVAASWSRGREADIAEYRSEKDVRTLRLSEGEDVVNYLWPIPESQGERAPHLDVLLAAARSITHLGWGVDVVAAGGSVLTEEDASRLPGVAWQAVGEEGQGSLRVPIPGTLDELSSKHAAALGRVSLDTPHFRPVPPLRAFGLAAYVPGYVAEPRPFAAFSLLKPDASGLRSFDPPRECRVVAAMARHAAGSEEITRVLGWPAEKVAGFILGHGEAPGEAHVPVAGPRLAYLPIPSIEPRGKDRPLVVGRVRRLVLAVLGEGGSREDLRRLGRLLSGAGLVAEGGTAEEAILTQIPDTDKVVRHFVRPSSTWATVTPVVLPGHDDPRKLRRRLREQEPRTDTPDTDPGREEIVKRLHQRIEQLLRKSIRQAGYSEELARCADLDWSGSGFWPGTAFAAQYEPPATLRRFRRLHVRLTWRDASGRELAIPGPLVLGGGRFQGLGLFAAC